MIARLTRFAMHSAYARYIGVSGAALGLDIGCFLVLLRADVPPVAASSLGYCVGLALHWLLSSRLVFAATSAARGSARRTSQKALFVVSALVGLAITTAIVALGTSLGLDPRLAKLAAVALAFQATWLIRRSIVFA